MDRLVARRTQRCGRASSVRYFGTVPGTILDAFSRRLRSCNLPTFSSTCTPPPNTQRILDCSRASCLCRFVAIRFYSSLSLSLSRARAASLYLFPPRAPDSLPSARAPDAAPEVVGSMLPLSYSEGHQSE